LLVTDSSVHCVTTYVILLLFHSWTRLTDG